jgi:hypothetical protein
MAEDGEGDSVFKQRNSLAFQSVQGDVDGRTEVAITSQPDSGGSIDEVNEVSTFSMYFFSHQ